MPQPSARSSETPAMDELCCWVSHYCLSFSGRKRKMLRDLLADTWKVMVEDVIICFNKIKNKLRLKKTNRIACEKQLMVV